MKACYFALLLATAFAVTEAVEPEVEENVIVLTDSNFDEWVNKQEFTIVEFYAPWCGHCKTLAPEYSEAAGILGKGSAPIYLAKVDATQYEALAQRFEVGGYPTLFQFRHGVKEEYDGPREAQGIVEFVEKEGPPAHVTLAGLSDVQEFVKGSEKTVLGIFRQPLAGSKMFQAFRGASKSKKSADWSFAAETSAKFDHTQNKFVASEVGAHYGVDMGVLVFSEYGAKARACKIKAKLYSEKKLLDCIVQSKDSKEL